jgi:hypothetical protein
VGDLRRGGSSARIRVAAAAAAGLTVVAGLAVRSGPGGWFAKGAGDALYTVLVYALVVLVAPALRPRRAAGWALAVSWAVELLQLTGVPAALSARSTLARLVLGTTFNLPDLALYVVGAALALAVHTVALRAAARRRGSPDAAGRAA